MSSSLLEIRNLKTFYMTKAGLARAVDDVSLKVNERETLGLVGESGCGKSTVALSLMRLILDPGKIVDGEIIFQGVNLLKLSTEDMRKVRGNKISMIFQDPMSSLNPVFKIGDQIAEAINLHQKVENRQEVERKVVEIMRAVGISNAEERHFDYPHEFSGGMRQRAMIAMALSCDPKLLIADEPTTALDVITQAQILALIKNLRDEFSTSVLYISHNLGVVAQLCDYVSVMYAGKIVEYGDRHTVFKKPMHPYTSALLKTVPRVDQRRGMLDTIPGSVPQLIDIPTGCRFAPRCAFASAICREKDPEMREAASNHFVSCFSPLNN